jgi:signal transduction histidine kinase/ligand-binding sensor domain-containing protein
MFAAIVSCCTGEATNMFFPLRDMRFDLLLREPTRQFAMIARDESLYQFHQKFIARDKGISDSQRPVAFQTGFSLPQACVGILGLASNCRPRFLYLTIPVLVLLCSFPSFAQISKLQFQHVSVEQGLSHPGINEICQDSTGFMWFGAYSGLNRFDGREVKSMDWLLVHALCTDRVGNVWIGTASVRQDVRCISTARDSIVSYELGGVRAIVCDEDTTMWIGSDFGLFRLNPKDGHITRMGREALADSGVNSMAMDGRGNLWLVTRSSILRFEKNALRSYLVSLRQTPTHSSTAVAPDGTVWIAGGSTGQFCKIDPATFQIVDVLEEGAQVISNAVAVDCSGLVYVGTRQQGLKIYNPAEKTWVTYRHSAADPQSLADDYVNCVVFDRNGSLWVGTASGVSWAAQRRRGFSRISAQAADESVPPEEVRDIVEDDEGNLWLGTAGGLRKWDRKKGTITTVKTARERITSLEIVRQHQLWIGMLGKKNLLRMDTHLGTRGINPEAISLPEVQGQITAMFRDSDTTMWLGCTRSKLYRHDLRTGRTMTYAYETPQQLWPNRVAYLGDDCPRMIYRDRQGVLWIATQFGILDLDEQSGLLKRYIHSKEGKLSFLENTWCIYEDTKGRFWVGNDQGLDLFDRSNGTFHPIIHSSRRLQGKSVVGILEDRTGALWLQTDGKLLRYHHDTGELREYGPIDGFPITFLGTFITWGNRARCETRNGEFVFGVRNGIALFRPEEMSAIPERPNVALTGVEIFGQPLPPVGREIMTFFLPKQPLCVEPSHNSFEFRFAGLDYAMPSQIKYAVWLEPPDHNWSYLGTQNTVRFMNLSPGSYRLRVKAANGDSAWSVHEATYRFEILPPWWMTWWFRTIAVLASVGVIVLLVQVRMRHRLAQERLRLQIASDLHDDIGSSLSSIALVSENVRNALDENHPAHPELRSMTSAARQAADRLKDDVWVIKPGSDTLENLLLRMKDVTQSLIGHLQFSFHSDTNGITRQVPLEFRRNILFIYKEALHNIVKHSNAGSVAISIRLEDGSFALEVRDNGRGFDLQGTPKGNGLINLRRRTDALKGVLRIESARNEGTRILVTVRIP